MNTFSRSHRNKAHSLTLMQDIYSEYGVAGPEPDVV